MVAVEPVLVAVLAYVILGEELSTRQLAGGAMVVTALGVVAWSMAAADAARPR